MFRNDTLIKPKNKSFFFAFVIALAAYFGAQESPLIGYFLALLTMLLIGFASDSIWPTIKKTENPIVFALFWGLVFGLFIPYLIKKISNEGFLSIIDLVIY